MCLTSPAGPHGLRDTLSVPTADPQVQRGVSVAVGRAAAAPVSPDREPEDPRARWPIASYWAMKWQSDLDPVGHLDPA